MILTGDEILKNVSSGNIVIDPFRHSQLNPNSYNFTLGNKLLVYENYVLDCKKDNPTREVIIPPEGLILSSNTVYLGCTEEIIGSEHFVPVIRGRSSIGRLGLFINITADLIDIGAINRFTLQLHAVQPVTVYPGMQIGQVTFWVPTGQISKYNGRYQNARDPIGSRMFMDFGGDS